MFKTYKKKGCEILPWKEPEMRLIFTILTLKIKSLMSMLLLLISIQKKKYLKKQKNV